MSEKYKHLNILTISHYKTEDGLVYDLYEDAEAHNSVLFLDTLLKDKSKYNVDDTIRRDLAQTLWDNRKEIQEFFNLEQMPF